MTDESLSNGESDASRWPCVHYQTMLLLLGLVNWAACSKVTIQNKEFKFNGQKLFLNGANQAWHWYGYDFGDGQYYKEPKSVYQRNIDAMKTNGGNALRVWLHTTGEGPSPNWAASGHVIGTDKRGSLVDELKMMLDYAKTKNVFVIISLWDGANADISQRVIDLMWDDEKLQSYFDNCLIPMATALKNHPALLAWEVYNEAEGIVYNEESNAEKCYDTNGLKGSGKTTLTFMITIKL